MRSIVLTLAVLLALLSSGAPLTVVSTAHACSSTSQCE